MGTGVIGGPPHKEFKMILDRPLVHVPMMELPVADEPVSPGGISGKSLVLIVLGLYLGIFALLVGIMVALPQSNAVQVAATKVEKVGVPMVPSACSQALDQAHDTVALTDELNQASGDYIRAVRSGDTDRIAKALKHIRQVRAQASTTNPAFVSQRDVCQMKDDGVDISLTQLSK